MVGAVLLNFSAAFDIIDHNLLLKIHRCYGFPPSALSWIEIYLSKRTHGSTSENPLSNANSVVYRRAAGLGHYSSVFTNDLPLTLNKACVSTYTDKSKVYTSATTVK